MKQTSEQTKDLPLLGHRHANLAEGDLRLLEILLVVNVLDVAVPTLLEEEKGLEGLSQFEFLSLRGRSARAELVKDVIISLVLSLTRFFV